MIGIQPYFSRIMLLITLVNPVVCQTRSTPASVQDQRLAQFLREYVLKQTRDGKGTRYSAGFADLRDDGIREPIVYLSGDGWCGTGGCTVLILDPDDHSFRLVTKVTVSRPPIRVLPTKSNGWHDIGIRIKGGGVQTSYESELSFDGKTYPRNPSVPPARKLIKSASGIIVVNSPATGIPLF